MTRAPLAYLEGDFGHPTLDYSAADGDELDRSVCKIGADELGHMQTHSDSGCAAIQEASLWRKFQPLHDNVDDRPGACLRTAGREVPERKPHEGARPLAAASSSGTLNIVSAR
ncbi:MAG: hypothetical protein ACRDM7_07485 [Thermoleophilaceae bacterium]